LLIQTFNFAEDADILPIVLHQNNLRPMYEKWLHGEQARWWTHAERYSILEQPVEFMQYIRARYQVVVPLACQAAISTASRSGSCRDDGQKTKEAHGKPPASQARPSQKASVGLLYSAGSKLGSQNSTRNPCPQTAGECTLYSKPKIQRRHLLADLIIPHLWP
jgi:hypothetical protein